MIKLEPDNINLFDFISQDIENNLDYYYDKYCDIYHSENKYRRDISLKLTFNFIRRFS